MSLPENNWVPLSEVVDIIYHKNFYWGALNGFTDCKYLELRIDTRDNCCMVRDRHHKAVDLVKLKAALETPILDDMNENPQLALLPVNP